MSELATFFSLMGAVVRDGDDGVALAQRFGESPSGNARVALYGTLVRRQHVEALDGFFAVLSSALSTTLPSSAWAELRNAWLDARVSPSRHPSGLGRPFAEWLGTQAASDAIAPQVVPPWATALAELACLQQEVAWGIESSLGVARVASFTHDVVVTLRSMSTQPRVVVAPPPRPTYVLVYPEANTLRARVMRLSAAEVAVLAWVAHEVDAETLRKLGLADAARDEIASRFQPLLGTQRIS